MFYLDMKYAFLQSFSLQQAKIVMQFIVLSTKMFVRLVDTSSASGLFCSFALIFKGDSLHRSRSTEQTPSTRLFPPGTHFTVESPEAMWI